MKARMPAGFGRPDMNALMRQAQKMQDDMKAKQAELEAAEYTGSASGEMVTVKMNGKHEVLSASPSSPRPLTPTTSRCWKIWWPQPSTPPSSRWTRPPRPRWVS